MNCARDIKYGDFAQILHLLKKCAPNDLHDLHDLHDARQFRHIEQAPPWQDDVSAESIWPLLLSLANSRLGNNA